MRTPSVIAVAIAALGLTATATATATATWAQDVENGQSVFKQCRACHQVGPTAKNLVGPQLNGIVGRAVGAAAGFNYSDASKAVTAKGTVWTEENLLAYLENPLAYMPGTKMAYAGLKDEGDRKDVIAYLKSVK